MKMIRALLCIAMILPLNFNLTAQNLNQKEELINHIRDHVKHGMSQDQIDSLYHLEFSANLGWSHNPHSCCNCVSNFSLA